MVLLALGFSPKLAQSVYISNGMGIDAIFSTQKTIGAIDLK